MKFILTLSHGHDFETYYEEDCYNLLSDLLADNFDEYLSEFRKIKIEYKKLLKED